MTYNKKFHFSRETGFFHKIMLLGFVVYKQDSILDIVAFFNAKMFHGSPKYGVSRFFTQYLGLGCFT